MRVLVSAVLAIGVSLSAALIAVGFASSFVVGWTGSLTGQPALSHVSTDFGDLATGLAALRPLAIGQLGLVFLVGTPIVRVLASLIAFGLEGDRLYVAITAIVLAILLASVTFIR